MTQLSASSQLQSPKRKTLWYGNVAIFVFILVLSFFYPLSGDDLEIANHNYLFNHTVLQKIHDYYFYWGGRISAYWISYVLQNKISDFILAPILSCIFPFLFVFLVNKSYKLAFSDDPAQHINKYCIFAFALILFFMKTHSFEVFLFKTMVLQDFVGNLVALFLLDKLFNAPDATDNAKLSIAYFVIGLLLGDYHEVIAAFIIGFCGLFLCIKYVQGRLPALRPYLGKKYLGFYSGIVLGFLVLFTAPGNAMREAYDIRVRHLEGQHFSVFQKVFIAFDKYLAYSPKMALMTIAIAAVLFIVTKQALKTARPKYTELEQQIIFYFCLLIGAILILTPFAYCYEGNIAGRVTFIPDLLLFILITKIVIFVGKYLPIKWSLPDGLAIVTLVVLLGIMLWPNYKHFQFNNARLAYLRLASQKGQENFIFAPYCADQSPFFAYFDLVAAPFSTDKNSWVNQAYAQYYNVAAVVEAGPCAIDRNYNLSLVNNLQIAPTSGEAKYYVDLIQQNPDKSIAIRGWGYIANQNVARTQKYLMLVSQNQRYIFELLPEERPDVTQALGAKQNLDLAGFRGYIAPKVVAPGLYKIQLYLQKGDISTLVATNSKILVNQ